MGKLWSTGLPQASGLRIYERPHIPKFNGSELLINWRVLAPSGRMGGMSSASARSLWSRILVIVGSIAMLVGAVDPLEGSLIILPLPGSGLVTLGTFLGSRERGLRIYWV